MRPTTAIRHVLSAKQFRDHDLVRALFERANSIVTLCEEPEGRRGLRTLRGEILVIFFEERSTRTRISFELAAKKLGMDVAIIEDPQLSSMSKGESIDDTVRILTGYCPSVMAIRTKTDGFVSRMAGHFSTPMINAGDGTAEHPTQALLDLFTIQKEVGRLNDVHVAMVGDLRRGRTVHSLAYLMGSYPGTRFTFISPSNYRMKPGILEYCTENCVPFTETENLSAARAADVLYVTRVQSERPDGSSGAITTGAQFETPPYVVDPMFLKAMNENAIIMHPLPRLGELPPEVDTDPRVVCFRQAAYGLPIRMALLEWVMNGHHNGQ